MRTEIICSLFVAAHKIMFGTLSLTDAYQIDWLRFWDVVLETTCVHLMEEKSLE